jgi:hypothetical protein
MLRVSCTISLVVAFGASPCAFAADKVADRKAVIDYSGWPATTEQPFDVAEQQLALCRPPGTSPDLGPHKKPGLRIFANQVARDALSKEPKSIPEGATVVKEKWGGDADRLLAYAAMIKRAPGYDPKHGDWEYVYVDFGGKSAVERGRIQSCIRCHASAKSRDYLFGTHLHFATKSTANNPANPSR